MKRNLKACFLTCAALLTALFTFSCGDLTETQNSTVTSLSPDKAIISLSVDNGSAKAVFPIFSTGDFTSFTLNGYLSENDSYPETPSLTKNWTSYTEMSSASFEISVGTWNFTLIGKVGNTVYEGKLTDQIIQRSTTYPLNFTLVLKSIDKNGTGTINVELTLPSAVKAAQASLTTLADVPVTGQSNKEFEISSTENAATANASFTGVDGGSYVIVMELYADADKKLLVKKFTEVAHVTTDGTTNANLTVAANEIETVYTIAYNYNSTNTEGNETVETLALTPAKYTRFNGVTLPVANGFTVPTGFVFAGWYETLPANNLTSTPVTAIESESTGNKTFIAHLMASAETSELTAATLAQRTETSLTAINAWPVNETKTVSLNSFSGAVTYQWQYADSADATDWTNITAATGENFKATSIYLGKYIRVVVSRTYALIQDSVTGNYTVSTGTTRVISNAIQITAEPLTISSISCNNNEISVVNDADNPLKLVATPNAKDAELAVIKWWSINDVYPDDPTTLTPVTVSTDTEKTVSVNVAGTSVNVGTIAAGGASLTFNSSGVRKGLYYVTVYAERGTGVPLTTTATVTIGNQ